MSTEYYDWERKICSIDGCLKDARCKQLCTSHYNKTRPKKIMTEQQRLKSNYYGIRSRAVKKNVPFELTIEHIEQTQKSRCIYCNSKEKSELDRKVPSDGYVNDNIVPACHRCNTLKNEVISYEDMKKVVEVLGWWNV